MKSPFLFSLWIVGSVTAQGSGDSFINRPASYLQQASSWSPLPHLFDRYSFYRSPGSNLAATYSAPPPPVTPARQDSIVSPLFPQFAPLDDDGVARLVEDAAPASHADNRPLSSSSPDSALGGIPNLVFDDEDIDALPEYGPMHPREEMIDDLELDSMLLAPDASAASPRSSSLDSAIVGDLGMVVNIDVLEEGENRVSNEPEALVDVSEPSSASSASSSSSSAAAPAGEISALEAKPIIITIDVAEERPISRRKQKQQKAAARLAVQAESAAKVEAEANANAQVKAENVVASAEVAPSKPKGLGSFLPKWGLPPWMSSKLGVGYVSKKVKLIASKLGYGRSGQSEQEIPNSVPASNVNPEPQAADPLSPSPSPIIVASDPIEDDWVDLSEVSHVDSNSARASDESKASSDASQASVSSAIPLVDDYFIIENIDQDVEIAAATASDSESDSNPISPASTPENSRPATPNIPVVDSAPLAALAMAVNVKEEEEKDEEKEEEQVEEAEERKIEEDGSKVNKVSEVDPANVDVLLRPGSPSENNIPDAHSRMAAEEIVEEEIAQEIHIPDSDLAVDVDPRPDLAASQELIVSEVDLASNHVVQAPIISEPACEPQEEPSVLVGEDVASVDVSAVDHPPAPSPPRKLIVFSPIRESTASSSDDTPASIHVAPAPSTSQRSSPADEPVKGEQVEAELAASAAELARVLFQVHAVHSAESQMRESDFPTLAQESDVQSGPSSVFVSDSSISDLSLPMSPAPVAADASPDASSIGAASALSPSPDDPSPPSNSLPVFDTSSADPASALSGSPENPSPPSDTNSLPGSADASPDAGSIGPASALSPSLGQIQSPPNLSPIGASSILSPGNASPIDSTPVPAPPPISDAGDLGLFLVITVPNGNDTNPDTATTQKTPSPVSPSPGTKIKGTTPESKLLPSDTPSSSPPSPSPSSRDRPHSLVTAGAARELGGKESRVEGTTKEKARDDEKRLNDLSHSPSPAFSSAQSSPSIPAHASPRVQISTPSSPDSTIPPTVYNKFMKNVVLYPISKADKAVSTQSTSTTRLSGLKSSPGPVVLGYFTSWGIYGSTNRPEYLPEQIPVESLTHLIYSFAGVKENGEVFLADAWADEQIQFEGQNQNDSSSQLDGNLKALYDLKIKNRNLKVLLAIGGTRFAVDFALPCATAQGRSTFVNSSIALLENYGLDGFDLGWHNPVNSIEADNYVALVKELREKLDVHAEKKGIDIDHRYELTIAAPCGKEEYEMIKVKEMDPYVTYWNLMSYHFSGMWSPVAGHQTAVYNRDRNSEIQSIAVAVNHYIFEGATTAKIIVGIPLFGQSFLTKKGPGSPFGGIGKGEDLSGIYSYRNLPLSGCTEANDPISIASWCQNESKGELISYDSPESALQKAHWVLANQLGGISFWDLSGDHTSPSRSLVSVVSKHFDRLEQRSNHLSYPQSMFSHLRLFKD